MVLQQPTCPTRSERGVPVAREICSTTTRPDDDRLLIGVRGDTSLTYVDVAVAGRRHAAAAEVRRRADRSEAPGGFATCDDAHRIITATSALASPSATIRIRPTSRLPDEPYALAIDDDDGLLFIGHLSGNTDAPVHGRLLAVRRRADRCRAHLDAPRFIAPFPSPFSANSVGSVGVTALNVQRHDGTRLRVVALRAAGRGPGNDRAVCPHRRQPRVARDRRVPERRRTTTRRSRAPRRAGSSSSDGHARSSCSGRRRR